MSKKLSSGYEKNSFRWKVLYLHKWIKANRYDLLNAKMAIKINAAIVGLTIAMPRPNMNRHDKLFFVSDYLVTNGLVQRGRLSKKRLKIEAKSNPTSSEVFYKSFAWRRVRYSVLEKRGAICECCGASRKTGAVIHVDHIKPLRLHWDLRLDPTNLQILCEECNHGKGSKYATDWRG